jgi:DNA polymerase-3 subunit alpha (Gram-positive type)
LLLAKNKQGLKDMYQLLSKSHTQYLAFEPKLPKQELIEHRANLLVGSGCKNGAIFQAALFDRQKTLEQELHFYDYIEVQPLSVYNQLQEENDLTTEQLAKIIQKIIVTAQQLQKLVIVSGDVHYLDPEDSKLREVLINNKMVGGRFHPLFKPEITVYPQQYLRTTDEMLMEFRFLNDSKLIEKIVIDNPQTLNNLIEKIVPFSENLFLPTIENVESKIKNVIENNLQLKYGQARPNFLMERLQFEIEKVMQSGYVCLF